LLVVVVAPLRVLVKRPVTLVWKVVVSLLLPMTLRAPVSAKQLAPAPPHNGRVCPGWRLGVLF
jgi:hypothetical protein